MPSCHRRSHGGPSCSHGRQGPERQVRDARRGSCEKNPHRPAGPRVFKRGHPAPHKGLCKGLALGTRGWRGHPLSTATLYHHDVGAFRNRPPSADDCISWTDKRCGGLLGMMAIGRVRQHTVQGSGAGSKKHPALAEGEGRQRLSSTAPRLEAREGRGVGAGKKFI